MATGAAAKTRQQISGFGAKVEIRMIKLLHQALPALCIFAFTAGAGVAEDAEAMGCPIPPEYREAAYNEPMRFFEAANRGNSDQSQWIVGVGVIEASTPEKFKDFLTTVQDRRKRILLHSPGGNLVAGMALGLKIREAGLSTHVGRTVQSDMEEEFPCRTIETAIESGNCSSSCAYAFLGGVSRGLSSGFHFTPESKLGFHQFYGGLDIAALQGQDPDFIASHAASASQVAMGYIASYLSELQLNPAILSLASSTTPDQMNYPDNQTLIDLGVITPSVFQSWFLEPFNNGVVAASREFNPLTSAQQLTAYCREETGEPVLMLTSDFSLQNIKAFLEPVSRPKDAKISQYPGELVIDGDLYDIPRASINVASTGDLVFIRMALTENLARHVTSSAEFTLTYSAPRSEGFQQGTAVLGPIDRKSISLAFRNCV